MVQEWSLNTQYQIFPSAVLEIGYVGSEGEHLFITQGFNQPQLASPSNPVNCGLPPNNATFTTDANGCITTNTAKNAAYRVPIMGFTPTALKGSGFSGNSWYHSLQVTLRKQLSHGLSGQVAYTYSKAEADTFNFNDLYTAVWAPAGLTATGPSYDRTHRLIATYNYELPSPVKSGFAGTMLAGWSVSGVTTVQTGTPLPISNSLGGTIFGNANSSTAQFCPGATNASVATSGRDQSRLNAWFNTSAICAIPALPAVLGGDGLATGYGNMGQGIVKGPGQFNWDMSLGKMTKVGGIREDAQLQFRTEFYNAFNHPQFANPGTAFSSISTFGVINATSVAPRLIQFGLKYIF